MIKGQDLPIHSIEKKRKKMKKNKEEKENEIERKKNISIYSHMRLHMLFLPPSLSIYIYISSCRATGMDISDLLSPLLPIVHRLWQFFRATSRILT